MNSLLDFSLRLERENAGLSQAQMAESLGVALSDVLKWEADPGEVSRTTLEKWAKACGYGDNSAAIDVGAPYDRLFDSMRTAICYLDRWNESGLGPIDVPTPEEIAKSLHHLALKPAGVVVGKPDAGKTRLLNEILGLNSSLENLPTGYGPATKLLCFIKHIDDRPTWLNEQAYLFREGVAIQEEDVAPYPDALGDFLSLSQNKEPLVFENDSENIQKRAFVFDAQGHPLEDADGKRKALDLSGAAGSLSSFVAERLREGFDPERLGDIEYIRQHCVTSGSIEILRALGVHEYQKGGAVRSFAEKAAKLNQAEQSRLKASEARYALIFLDAPILKATDIIDTPGFSDHLEDVTLALKGIKQSTYLIHCSTVAGYMGSAEDRMLMQEAIKRLPLMPSEMGDEPFSNILLLATMAAPYITDADLTKAIDVGIMRLGRHLAMVLPHEIGLRMARSGEPSAVPSEADVVAKLRRQAFPFFAEIPARRKQTIFAIKHLIGRSLPPQWETFIDTKVQDILHRSNVLLQGKLHELQERARNVRETREELDRLKEFEPKRKVFVREKIEEITSLIYEYREECEADARKIAQFYYHWPNVCDLIVSRYNNDDKAEAKVGIAPLVTESINREVVNASKNRCKALDKVTREFVGEYALKIDKLKANTEFQMAGGDSNTLGMILGGGATAAFGGAALLLAFPLAPLVALGMLVGGAFAFLQGVRRSWQEKLAREVSGSLQNANLVKILVDANTGYWREVEDNFHRACEEMERRYKHRIAYLNNAVKGDGEANFTRDIDHISRVIDFLKNMPWRKDAVTTAA